MSTRQQANREPGKKSVYTTLTELVHYVLPPGDWWMRLRVGLALGCLGAEKVAAVAIPLLYGAAVNSVSSGRINLTTVWWLICGYGGIRLSQELFGELKQLVFARVTQRAVRGAAWNAFSHLHTLSLKFHLDRQTGGLTRAIDRGAKAIDFLLHLTMFEILPVVVEVTLVAGVLWKKYGVYYALVTTGTVVIYICCTIVLTEWRMRFRNHLNAADESAATRSIDSLLNYETVKYFNAEAAEAQRYDKALHAYENAAVKWRTSIAAVNFVQGTIIAIGLVLVMGMAAKDIWSGTLTVGDFVVVNTYLLQLYLPLGFLGYVYREVRSSLADMSRMFSLLDEKSEVQDQPGASELVVYGGEVEFDNVSFSYNGSKVLEGVSFCVPAGRKVAIVGPSGAGKSTLVRLLFRFYDPDDGMIRIDDQDIKSVTQASVRAAIGVVPQDPVLFNDSIGLNIAYGRIGASQGEIKEAAHLAALERFIDLLPDRYDTLVGERGLKLSGGERQRVAIARAILKSPKILLLDEATSALDSRTEQDIQQAINRISQSRTTLMIAHRLSTVADADVILVLANGQVVEQGDHKTLLAQDGTYAAMWRWQQGNDENAAMDDIAQQTQPRDF